MQVVMEQIDVDSGHRINNMVDILLIFLLKAAVNTIIFHVLCRKWRSSFLGLCGMSLVVFDWVMTGLLLTTWLVQTDWSIGSPCFPFAFTSMTYRALALPMMFFGFIDNWFNDSGTENKISSRFQRNVLLALLMWLIAIFHPISSWRRMMIEVRFELGTVFFVCEAEESMLMVYTVLGLFTATLLTLVSFWSIPHWLRKINRIIESRDKVSKNHNSEETTNATQPPLWFNLTLGFAIAWIIYLSVSVGCILLGMKTPAYITMNLYWVECVNNALAAGVFWIKHHINGSQNQPPEDVCTWQIYWYLSRGTDQQQPVEVFEVNPTEEEKVDFLYV